MSGEHGGKRIGAGRPKELGDNPVRITFDVPRTLVTHMDRKRGSMSRSAWIRRAMVDLLREK